MQLQGFKHIFSASAMACREDPDGQALGDALQKPLSDFLIAASESLERVALLSVDADQAIALTPEHALVVAQIRFEKLAIPDFRDVNEAGIVINDETYKPILPHTFFCQLRGDVETRLRAAQNRRSDP